MTATDYSLQNLLTVGDAALLQWAYRWVEYQLHTRPKEYAEQCSLEGQKYQEAGNEELAEEQFRVHHFWLDVAKGSLQDRAMELEEIILEGLDCDVEGVKDAGPGTMGRMVTTAVATALQDFISGKRVSSMEGK